MDLFPQLFVLLGEFHLAGFDGIKLLVDGYYA